MYNFLLMFATASWCPPSCPPSPSHVFPSWLLTLLFLHPPPPLLLLRLLLCLSILILCVAAARPLVLPHRLTAFGPACHLLELDSPLGQDRPLNPHRAGQASQTHPAGLGCNQLQSLSPLQFHSNLPLKS